MHNAFYVSTTKQVLPYLHIIHFFYTETQSKLVRYEELEVRNKILKRNGLKKGGRFIQEGGMREECKKCVIELRGKVEWGDGAVGKAVQGVFTYVWERQKV